MIHQKQYSGIGRLECYYDDSAQKVVLGTAFLINEKVVITSSLITKQNKTSPNKVRFYPQFNDSQRQTHSNKQLCKKQIFLQGQVVQGSSKYSFSDQLKLLQNNFAFVIFKENQILKKCANLKIDFDFDYQKKQKFKLTQKISQIKSYQFDEQIKQRKDKRFYLYDKFQGIIVQKKELQKKLRGAPLFLKGQDKQEVIGMLTQNYQGQSIAIIFSYLRFSKQLNDEEVYQFGIQKDISKLKELSDIRKKEQKRNQERQIKAKKQHKQNKQIQEYYIDERKDIKINPNGFNLVLGIFVAAMLLQFFVFEFTSNSYQDNQQKEKNSQTKIFVLLISLVFMKILYSISCASLNNLQQRIKKRDSVLNLIGISGAFLACFGVFCVYGAAILRYLLISIFGH